MVLLLSVVDRAAIDDVVRVKEFESGRQQKLPSLRVEVLYDKSPLVASRLLCCCKDWYYFA